MIFRDLRRVRSGPKKIIKSCGESNEPCGTPFCIGKIFIPSMEPHAVCKSKVIILIVVQDRFYDLRLSRRMLWSTLSNADYQSTNKMYE